MSRICVRVREVVAAARSPQGQRGQVIVLFAFALVALLLIGALVLDVARVYTALQFQRSVTDAAALAGAQDLQEKGTSVVNTTDYARAKCDAYAVLVRQLGGSNPPNCSVGSEDLLNFPSTTTPSTKTGFIGDYSVAITTPYNGSQTVDHSLAVKVTISRPNFALTFGNAACLLPGSGCSAGAPVWNPTVASVAGSYRVPQYALMTLQPDPNLCNGSTSDLVVSGGGTGSSTGPTGTTLNIVTGDVGTNSTACTTNPSGAKPSYIKLVDPFLIDHYASLPSGPTWLQINGEPIGQRITSLIRDPNYVYPTFSGAPSYSNKSQGAYTSSQCTDTYLPPGLATATPGVNWTCYRPGIYSGAFNVTGSDGAYLTTGAYEFDNGLSVSGTLAGGLVNGAPGVVLYFSHESVSANFSTGSTGGTVWLNVGGCDPITQTCSLGTNGTSPATAAVDSFDTSWTGTTPQGLVLTVMVQKDSSCFDGGVPVQPPCSTTGNKVVKLAGNPTFSVAGVIYGPSDNMQIRANSTYQNGIVGQIVSYTVSYSGGAQLNQQYPAVQQNNVLRLDTACSPGANCP